MCAVRRVRAGMCSLLSKMLSSEKERERFCLLPSDPFALLSLTVQKSFPPLYFSTKLLQRKGSEVPLPGNLSCRREIATGILTPQGNSLRAAGGDGGKPRARSVSWPVLWGCCTGKCRARTCSWPQLAHTPSDVYFPAGRRPDLDIEQRISPVKRFLGSLIYI